MHAPQGTTRFAESLTQTNTAELSAMRRALSLISQRLQDRYPVQSALYAAAGQLLEKLPPPEQRKELISEVLELLSWLGPAAPPMSESEGLGTMRVLEKDYLSAGLSPVEVVSAIHSLEFTGLLDMLLRKRGRGRPITRRYLAVTAFDNRLTDPRKSWMRVTLELCPSRKSPHDARCKDQLLQRVKELKLVLKKYQIVIPVRPRP